MPGRGPGQKWLRLLGATGLRIQRAEDALGLAIFGSGLERAGQVEVGFRWPDDGTTGHLAHFDAAAFKDPAKRCVWRSLWDFAMG